MPVSLDEHLFTLNFFLLDHIFSSHGLEAVVIAVLGSSFLRENYIRTQWTLGNYELMPSPLTTDPIPDVASEGEEIGRLMKFLVYKTLYKNHPHYIERARVAIEAFQQTPPNA